ncbi:MAG: hypothetical protein MZV49_18915 [Rhodopseudomonas palustris]|nr:hypothetical protein [Rhodopseudomonas palustris]
MSKPEEKLVVPQAALLADQGGVYVFAVQSSEAEVRRVKQQQALFAEKT